ncbi:ABC transporter ATP-binding protein [Magnetospira sp. QH-2]|uniref:ABC transporter ATP-binding protein n=1 Tax=Magnetospira sp. (strain QH-2) TaxID=1288970 RepID=UPI0003E81065|nr:ABC transporter transmembrane domain-containing protein [Magnetospira sp. QH-2]CCQ74893.1 putative ABC transporter, ATPase and permease components [Magnetospira sp. QH-2]
MSEPESSARTKDPNATSVLLGRLLRENVAPYKWWIFWALLFMAVVAASTGLTAYLLDPVITYIFDEKRHDLVWPLVAAILATFVVKGGANYMQTLLMSRVGLRIIADNQNRLFRHLARMDLTFFHANPTGTLVSRFTVDIAQMRVAVSNGLTALGKDLLTLIALVGVMFYEDWQLSLIALVAFPTAIYPIARLGKRMRKVTANNQQEMGLLTTTLEQSFQGIRVVKAYGMEDYETERVVTLTDRIYALAVKAASTRAFSSPIMETLGGLAVAAVIAYAGNRVIHEDMRSGALIAFIAALLMAYEPMKRLANLNASLQEGLAGAQRMFQLLDNPSDLVEAVDAKDLDVAGGSVSLEKVRFSYDGENNALDGLSLEVPAGSTVALVGPSGAGKSTVLNLIPRFYDLNSGRVVIDGQDIKDVTFTSLRGAMALVSQEITLFDDTVRANIAYGRFGASEEDIQLAASHAAAHDFILKLPQGYDTMVGEQGVKLSGGQRQRLAIARAMLKNAPILLLDEATSALDTESERQVQAALDELMKDRTTLVIAHRLSTVVQADLIHVVDRGRVVESGTHDQLLAADGIYARLYALQFDEREEAVVETDPEVVGDDTP